MDTAETSTSISKTISCGNCGADTKADGAALSRCGGFNGQYYCSTECQKNDWKAHKGVCKTNRPKASSNKKKAAPGSGYIAGLVGPPEEDESLVGPGVWITPFSPPEAMGRLACGFTVATQFDITLRRVQHTATELEISAAVGYPLCILGGSGRDCTFPNLYAHVFSLIADASSPSFGQPCWSMVPIGSTIVMRTDGRPLHTTQLSALINFCCMINAKILDMEKREKGLDRVQAPRSQHDTSTKLHSRDSLTI